MLHKNFIPSPAKSLVSSFYMAILLVFGNAFSQIGGGESGLICEFKPAMPCLDVTSSNPINLKVHESLIAIERDGLNICDKTETNVQAPDIVLIMDNTGSMGVVKTVDNIPRYCENVGNHETDPPCISGDPKNLRGPSLHAFLDSALIKSGGKSNVGVVLFDQSAYYRSANLTPLTQQNLAAIKAEVKMEVKGRTNYTAAFEAAMLLLQQSTKPKDQQAIIFISDGRPNEPKSNPYAYKQSWNAWPQVHAVFLGDNKDNYEDMTAIANKTGGLFFAMRDVTKLASVLTKDISEQIFKKSVPRQTTLNNAATGREYIVPASGHIFNADSAMYSLILPGPIYLENGLNAITVKTDFGATTRNASFNVTRSSTGPFDTPLSTSCRELPRITLFNHQNEPISDFGRPFIITDKNLKYSVTTNAAIDSFTMVVENSISDRENQKNTEAAHKTDSITWTNSLPFAHNSTSGKPNDKSVQTRDGDLITLIYRNPYLPPDSARISVSMSYGPAVLSAVYWDLNGDGQAETVIVDFEKDLSALPDRLEFQMRDSNGKKYTRTALLSKGEIAFGKDANGNPSTTRVVVTLATPFPYGITSQSKPDSLGRTFRQDNIPLSDSYFSVSDSLPPVIIKAEVKESNGSTLVSVTFSEPVNVDPTSVAPLLIKRDNQELTLEQLQFSQVVQDPSNPAIWNFHVNPISEYLPVGGDSISINPNGAIKDLTGLQPEKKIFRPVSGPSPKQEVKEIYVVSPGIGSKEVRPAALPSNPGPAQFVLVDRDGNPLAGSTDGKCGTCYVGQNESFVGPVLHIVTEHPVDYTFMVFSNLGAFVSQSKGKLTESDLAQMQKVAGTDGEADRYVARVIWNGMTTNQSKAGTGAYVLKAVFNYPRNFRLGAAPSQNTRILTFGYMRAD